MTTQQAADRKPDKGQELELRVESLAFGGNGVARLPLGERSYVVFVRDALPGDRVRAVVTKRKRDYAEARTVEVIEPGPDRIAPVAHHPGAPWQILPYERQLAVKAEQVEDALRRLGRLDGFEMEEIVPAVEQWRYRNKLEYSFGSGDDGGLVCGFHAPGSWERIEPVEDCLLASERGNELRRRVLDDVSRARPRRVRPPRADRVPAQPRGSRGSPHRAVPGPRRDVARRARRRTRWSRPCPTSSR